MGPARVGGRAGRRVAGPGRMQGLHLPCVALTSCVRALTSPSPPPGGPAVTASRQGQTEAQGIPSHLTGRRAETAPGRPQGGGRSVTGGWEGQVPGRALAQDPVHGSSGGPWTGRCTAPPTGAQGRVASASLTRSPASSGDITGHSTGWHAGGPSPPHQAGQGAHRFLPPRTAPVGYGHHLGLGPLRGYSAPLVLTGTPARPRPPMSLPSL